MQKKLKIESAFSMSNGIGIDSVRHKGYAAIATIDEEGIISTQWTAEGPYEEEEITEKVKKLAKLIMACVVFVVISIIYSRMHNNPIYAIRTFIVVLEVIFGIAFLMYISGRDESVAKFHSAEHMVCNAFRQLRRTPTLEEIVSYSRFSNYCGTNITAVITLWNVLNFGATFIPNEVCMFTAIALGSIVVVVLGEVGKLNFLQYFTTREPTKKELIVAIEAMKVFIENENKEME